MDPATDWVVSGGRLALDMDNTNDQVVVPHVRELDAVGFSFSMWYRPNTVAAGFSPIWAQWVSPGFGPIASRNGSVIWWQTNTTANRAITSSVLTANAWHHLVFICGSTLRVFVNGVLDGASATPLLTANSQSLIIAGPVSGAGTGNGNCLWDDAIAFNAVLTPSDVLELYRRGRGAGLFEERRRPVRSAAGFKAYWARNRSSIIGAGNVSS
jgi:Concanavalin A-like lectin/glucanases superfamily